MLLFQADLSGSWMKNVLLSYCENEDITMGQLANRIGMSQAQLYLINNDPRYNVRAETINKIYLATGLRPFEYLDFDCFKQEIIQREVVVTREVEKEYVDTDLEGMLDKKLEED